MNDPHFCPPFAFQRGELGLTGGVIAGGSESIHQLVEVFRTFADKSEDHVRT